MHLLATPSRNASDCTRPVQLLTVIACKSVLCWRVNHRVFGSFVFEEWH